MHSKAKLIETASVLLVSCLPLYAGELVYDNLATSATAGFSEPNANAPIFGDSLTLLHGGVLNTVGASLFNSSSGGNTGVILAGNMELKFYDNTVPYSGGALALPLLGSANVSWDFTGEGGLPAGFYSTGTFDLSALNIGLTDNILITQQFTETSGGSTRNGVVLLSDPTIGSSPNTVYIKSLATSEGLYTFSGNPGQFGYSIEVTNGVPDVGNTLAMLSGLVGLLPFARRLRC